nr:phosphomannomutase/phosphoglucomutase [Clostridia bacterium]
GSIMITASHLPFNRNGLKFFSKQGGLEKADVTEILTLAANYRFSEGIIGEQSEKSHLDTYANGLVNLVRKACGENAPLSGKKIIVDAGNGAGGFFADKVLAPLGANTDGSQFLEPDGRFPNHIPNPENKDAMRSVCEAVKSANADFGIIFDTDVDRAGAVDKQGNEINRNRLIALISAILLEEKAGTIVTDSVTSDGLAKFIKAKGGRHHRFKRGYKNVINEAIRLNEAGEYTPLAIETSGHAALKENYFLDDGAYLIVRLLIALAKASKAGKELTDLIEDLETPREAAEVRVKFSPDCDFKSLGQTLLKEFAAFVQTVSYLELAPDNYEGCRVAFDKKHGDGWVLLRMSLHDPILPINAESDSDHGVLKILKEVYYFLKKYPFLDLTPLQDAIKEQRQKLLDEVKRK